MAIVLEARSADGAVTRTPVEAGRNSFRAQPGMRYRILDDAGAKIDDAISIRRIGNDLVISGLPEDRLVEFDGFFSRCTPQNSCELMLENLGAATPAASITPASEPLAAQRDGSFLMYAGKSAETALPVAPEAEPPGTFRTVGLVVAGLALAAAGGGGGGGGGESSAPTPVAPTLTSVKASNDATPILSGTGTPGSTVAITIVVTASGQNVSYQVPVDGNGNWTVDTGTAVPSAGAMPAGGFPNGELIVRLNAPNTGLPVVTEAMSIDTVRPAVPVISRVTSDDLVTGPERTAGVAVSGTAEANATVAVTWGTITRTVTAGSDGTWVATFIGSDIPEGTLNSEIRAQATDAAGNASTAGTRLVAIDTVSAVAIGVVATDNIINGTERLANVVVGGEVTSTNRANASVLVTLSAGAQAVNRTVTANATGQWTVTFTPAELAVFADGTQATITATATDSVGNVGSAPPRSVLFDLSGPTAPSVTLNAEVAGGLNAIEAGDGTLVSIGLAGTGAVAGDVITLRWGTTQTVMHTITAAEVNTTVVITVAPSVIANAGNAAIPVSAFITDTAGNVGTSSGQTVVNVDTAGPTLTITDNASGTANGPVTYTFTWSEAVTGFAITDITTSGLGTGTFGSFSGSGTTYTAVFTPAASESGTANVSVGPGVVTDAAGNANTGTVSATAQPYVPADTTPPTLTITDSVTGTANGPVTYTFTWSEAVTGFAITDITTSGLGTGTFGSFSGSGTTYTAVFTPAAGESGTANVSVGPGVVTDAAGNANTGTVSATAQPYAPADTTPPALTITDSVTGTANGPVTYTFTWSEAVTGFAITDITTSGLGTGTFGSFSGSGTTYTAIFTPAAGQTGTANVSVGPGVVTDAAGNANTGTVSATAQPYAPADTTPPALTITDSVTGTANGPVTYTFTWSEAVTGFAITDITTSGLGTGTFGSFSGSGTTYTAVFTPAAGESGTANVSVGPGVVTDAAGNANTGTVSATAQPYAPADTTPPTLTITDSVTGTANGPVTYTFTWSEAVTGFAITDITTSGLGTGTFGSFSGSGTTYTAIFTPAAGQTGTANVSVGPGVVTDAAGNANTGTTTAAAQAYDAAPPASVTSIALNPSSDSAPTGDNQTTDTTPTLTLTLNALLGSDTIRVYMDSSSTPLVGTASGTGTTVDFTPTAAIAAGSHSFSASAIDAAGNVSPLLPPAYTLLIL